MVSCYVSVCEVTRRNNQNKYTFHRFPNNSVLKEKWIRILNRDRWSSNKNSTICSKHFESKCFIQRKRRRVLMKESLPNLFVLVQLRIRKPGSYVDRDISLSLVAVEPLPGPSNQLLTPRKKKLLKTFDINFCLSLHILSYLYTSLVFAREKLEIKEREQVPSQSVMKKRMGLPLADVYLKSMNYKLKVLAGLEPPLKGGGNDWYVPPEELLKGRAVLKPGDRAALTKLGFGGIGILGDRLVRNHYRRMEEEKQRVLLESDINWKKTIEVNCRQQWEDCSNIAAATNTETIQSAFNQFMIMYRTSITNIESILFDSTIKEIERIKTEAHKNMAELYKKRVKVQATELYDLYIPKLEKEKLKRKNRFIRNVEKSRTLMVEQVHDANVDKHVIIEKIRQLLKSRNLACQIYVALKEREECKKEIELAKYEHKKKIKVLREQIALTDFEIRLAQEKERKREEFNTFWKKKVCHVVKKLQMFVSFCLNSLPEYADFFIDMEKLMMLQLNNVVENPSVASIFERDAYEFHTPVPRPHPFYLFCDRGYKPPNIEQKLCPKHCTSSASQLPVIVVNKRCIYAACDNFEMYTNKITEFLHGQRGEELDFEDHHDYSRDVPVKCTSKERIEELKLESPLLQLLQSEIPNVNKLPIECCLCKIPYCFCSPPRPSAISIKPSQLKPPSTVTVQSIPSGNKIETRSAELAHEREPKIESYLNYVTPKKCKCAKMAKKHLVERMPVYMRKTSKYESSELPNYEMCPLDTLKELVRNAQGKQTPPPSIKISEPRTRDMGTQYSDQEYEMLCTCFSDEELDKFLKEMMKGADLENAPRKFNVVGDDLSHSYLSQRTSSFATECAYNLRSVLDTSPQLEEIFKKEDCHYD